MLTIAAAKPPYVQFKQVAIEDRNLSIENGRRITKNVNMAFIQQVGQRDQVERIAEEWLDQLKRQCYEEIQPAEFYVHFKKKYEDWKAGIETPEHGTPITEWPVLSPAQVENLRSIHSYTVESIAQWGEEALNRYGMGGRELREKAKAWLESGDKNAEKLLAVEAENRSLKDMIEKLAAKVAALEDDKPKAGRPRKDAE